MNAGIRRAATVVVAALIGTATASPAAPNRPGAAQEQTSAATSWAQPCNRNDAADANYIAALYRTFANRPPTGDELTFWRIMFHNQGIGIDVPARFAANDPWFAANTVAAIYSALLHRSPDPAGLQNWTAWIRARGAVNTTAEIAASAEYWRLNGSSWDGFVTGLYRDLLGRAADPSGLAWWVDQLSSGQMGSRTATASFDQTPESRLRRASAIYPRVLHRDADPGGAAWAASVLVTNDEAGLAAVLATSLEFWRQAQEAAGAPVVPVPAPCPKPPPRWVPDPGTVVRNLQGMPWPPGPRILALTFDDGPNPTWTPQILDVLDRYDVPATFFVLGYLARAYPDLVRAEVARGHHVADHSWDHPDFNRLSAAAQASQIRSTADLVDSLVGPGTVRCFRPPYGNYSSTTVAVARDRGLATILWSRDGRDWARPGVPAIVNGNLDTRYDGGKGLILLHDGGGDRSQTVAALPPLINALRSQGYVFVQLC